MDVRVHDARPYPGSCSTEYRKAADLADCSRWSDASDAADLIEDYCGVVDGGGRTAGPHPATEHDATIERRRPRRTPGHGDNISGGLARRLTLGLHRAAG